MKNTTNQLKNVTEQFKNSFKLQKVMAQMMNLSRRAAEKLIEQKKVSVNGQIAHIGQRVDAKTDQIKVEGQLLTTHLPLEYIKINKPIGLITSKKDELNRPTVMTLLPQKYQHLFPVGRLDMQSEGLILMTNDGDLAEKMTHPRFHIEKTYQVLPDRKVSQPAFSHLKRGMKIDRHFIKPVAIHRLPKGWLSVTITSGQKHIIRKMMAKSGYETDRLVRVQFGPIELGELVSGQWELIKRPIIN